MYHRIVGLAVLISTVFFSAAAVADQIAIGFKVGNGNIPSFSAPSGSVAELANDALVAKYGAENGFLGTALGARGELDVYVLSMNHGAAIWRKMLSSGDALSGPGGTGYFVFDNPNDSPMTGYTYVGKLQIDERSTGTFLLINGTPAISSYIIAMERGCTLVRSGVIAAQAGQPLAPTRLVASRRIGSYTIAYEHEVNAGTPTLLSGIRVELGAVGGPIVIDICPVDLYVRY